MTMDHEEVIRSIDIRSRCSRNRKIFNLKTIFILQTPTDLVIRRKSLCYSMNRFWLSNDSPICGMEIVYHSIRTASHECIIESPFKNLFCNQGSTSGTKISQPIKLFFRYEIHQRLSKVECLWRTWNNECTKLLRCYAIFLLRC